MGRILAIDYGQKRCGIAVTDELRIIANALETVSSKELIAYLTRYVSKEDVSLFVIGEPKQMNNQPSDASRFINPFIGRLKNAFPTIPIERMDERFTSRMAFQSMIDAGLGKKARQNKELIDSISATLILQSYLETKTHN
ncbi:MAG: Holliday junction resolvase RuvX [Bacteroidales bacterium]|nr:Holliday junction resolvase RuvX [Bacteroidales bacterium]